MDLSTVTISGVVVIPLISAIIEMLKRIGLKEKWCPISSVIIGVVIGILYLMPTQPTQGFIVGIALGLSSCGLYDNIHKIK